MTVSLELDREARRRGCASEFVPTGQTGIAIAGWGISVDAVVADFIAGAAEQLVLEGVERGGEVLFVEGQGSLLHPGVLRRHARADPRLGAARATCSATRRARRSSTRTSASRSRRSPSSSTLHEQMSLLARPARVLAVALNTRDLDEDAARRAIEEAEAETGLPADDPVRFGAGEARRRARPQPS